MLSGGPAPSATFGDPYVVITVEADGKKTKVAIFGLLDPDLQGTIGRLNYGWWNKNTAYETTAQVSSLTDALSQAMMHCELDDECKLSSTHKILLAQMPAAKATQLLGSIKKPVFELVVTETDAGNRTLEGTVTRSVSPGDSPKFVVVPNPPYAATRNAEDQTTIPITPQADLYSPGALTFQIQKASVSSAPGPTPKVQVWTLTNNLREPASASKPNTLGLPELKDAPGCGSSGVLKTVARRTLVKEGVADNMTGWSSAQVLQRLALLVMQHDPKHHTDISMIQSRDLFRPEIYGQAPISNCNLQEVLDRLFWKGDYAVSVPVTGASLTSILKASDTFTTFEANPTNIDLERGRSLVTLGVFKDGADQNLTVNGTIVDPTKAYAAALTDYLALADTGYMDLKTPLVPYPYRIKDFRRLDSISAMICRAIKKAVLNDAQCYQVEQSAEDHLDISTDLPPDQTPGTVANHQMRSYLAPTSRWSRFTDFYSGQNAAEVASANKHFWSIDLEKSDFGLNFSRPASSAALKAEFTGITTAPVTAPVTYSISLDDRARLKFSTPTVDWYLQHESTYSYTRTGGTSFTRNLSQNVLAGETGLLWHILWVNRRAQGRRQPQEFDLLGASRVESQVQAPRGDFALATSPPSILLGALRRPVDMFAKAGFRYSDDRSWFEAGYLAGRSLVNPTTVVFKNGQTTVANLPLITGSGPLVQMTDASGNPLRDQQNNPIYVMPGPNAPFSTQLSYLSSPGAAQMITSQDTFYATYTDRPLSGFFVNFSLNTPLPFGSKYADWAGGKPISLLIENVGKWLFDYRNDLSTQTKYYDKLAWSLVIPLIGNLAFKPEVDFVYFRNKSQELPNQQTSFSFHSTTYIGTLSYTFSWKQGQPFCRLWRYASPAPSSSTPASGR